MVLALSLRNQVELQGWKETSEHYCVVYTSLNVTLLPKRSTGTADLPSLTLLTQEVCAVSFPKAEEESVIRQRNPSWV